MIPALLTRPTVGFTPTRPLALDGQTTEPSVSVPRETAARLAAVAAPDPELEKNIRLAEESRQEQHEEDEEGEDRYPRPGRKG